MHLFTLVYITPKITPYFVLTLAGPKCHCQGHNHCSHVIGLGGGAGSRRVPAFLSRSAQEVL